MLKWVTLVAAILSPSWANAEVLYHYTMPIGDDRQSFRAIVTDEACPEILIDGKSQPMRLRAGPVEDFPNRVCEHIDKRDIASARLGENLFPLSPTDPRGILVIGDTGCRLKKGDPIQRCTNPEEWPFKTVAASMAEKEADLAIHLGDYHYREMECPDPAKCGSVYGNNWLTWEADFFAPGRSMLNAHPFVFVRGNHEKCGRAWVGYLRYLALHPIRTPYMCDNFYPATVVGFDSLQLALIDSSTRNRSDYTWDRLRAMRAQFQGVLPQLDRETWLLTHTPLWGYGNTKNEREAMGTLESIQREAFGDMLPRLVSAVVAGDIHFAQIVSTDGNPVQITFGNGGVALYATPSGLHENLEVGNGVTGDLFGYQDFGFGFIDRNLPGVPVTLFDRNGVSVVQCLGLQNVDSCTAN